METPKEYYYTYYSYEEWGRGYFGSRGCKCLPEEDVKYFGSYTDKTFKPTHKIILKSDYATREEAYADEIILHDYYDVANNPHFANQAKASSTKFYVSRELAVENGKKYGKLGGEIGGKINGKYAVENKLGIFSLSEEEKIKYCKMGGNKIGQIHKENKTGVCGIPIEERRKNSKKGGEKGGKKCKENKTGIFALSKEQMTENGKKGGKKSAEINKKNGTAVYGIPIEERRKNSKKGYANGLAKIPIEQKKEIVKKTNSQKWMCTETGYITTSGALANYQKARGIDTSKRVRIS
jgi:hypothetical protein